MQFLIVTGMSGAGKSQTANILEDMGYYCVDNVPPELIPAFVDLSQRGIEEMGKIAVITDIRGGDMFDGINAVLDNLKRENKPYKILFLDSADQVLIRRYKENRRKHPLCEKGKYSLEQAVKAERQKISALRHEADYVVDTSQISVNQLKTRIVSLFSDNKNGNINILVKSFGFKNGTDVDADIIFDVRCLKNPFYDEKLKTLTGLDKAVRDYVMDDDNSKKYAQKLFDFIDFSIPLYISEGKSQLVISFGCTGGKHRSVTFAELLKDHLCEKGMDCAVIHRDIEK